MVNNIKKTSNKTPGTLEAMENIKVLIHRLNNILGLIESCINRLKHADVKTLNKRWIAMKDVIIATGRDRLSREIELYKKTKDTIERTSGEKYKDVFKQFSEADQYFKTMFDLLDGSGDHSEKNKDTVLTNGEKLSGILRKTINEMETIKIGLQKKQTSGN